MTAAINRCPYCNSSDIAIDVNVTIGCHLEDGMLMLDDGYFDVDHVDERGFWFRPEGK